MYPEYDNISFIIYMTWGLLFVLGVYKIKTCSAENGYKVSLNSKIWLRISVAFFVIVATFRLVTPFGVGGADATSYKDFYETFFMKNATVYHGHLDVGYQLIYGVFRYFTDDYHYCFCFQHIVFISAIFLFVREFRMKNTNYAPYVLLVHSYVLGFSSMRSSFGMALIWFSFVLLHREKAKWAFLVAAFSLLIHKACAIYFMALPFYLIFRDRTFTLKHALTLLAIAIMVGGTLQMFFVQFAQDVDLGGAYGSYARDSTNLSFWEQAYRTAIEQLLLGALMIIMNKRFQRHLASMTERERRTLKMLWLLCIFDLVLIPVNYFIGNWRAPEFLYVVRIVMWGEMLWLLFKPYPKNIQRIFTTICMVMFMARMQQSFVSMAAPGGLMPYIFEPFMNFFL